MNWYTTIAGFLAAVLPWLGAVVPELDMVFKAAGSLALAIMAYFAKDK